MNAMFSKIVQFLDLQAFPSSPASAAGDIQKTAEADSFLYGDGMGWTCVTAAMLCGDGNEPEPAACLK